MKKRRFSKAFKLSILEELQSGKPIANICNEHNISKDMVSKWKCQYKKDPKRTFRGHGKASSLEAELNKFKRLVGQLYAEKIFLKKCIQNLQENIVEERLKERGVHSRYLPKQETWEENVRIANKDYPNFEQLTSKIRNVTALYQVHQISARELNTRLRKML